MRLPWCRIDEVGPTAQMLRSSFVADKADFADVSPDFADDAAGKNPFLKEYDKRYDKLETLVPTANQRATDAEVTKAMNQIAKSLREPINRLNLRLNRAVKRTPALTAAPAAFGLGKVRKAIVARDMEKLDGALKGLLDLVKANATPLGNQGHTAADTKTFVDARKTISEFNVTQNDNANTRLVLTEENMMAANALWELMDEILDAGRLMYKETKPRKAVAYTLARLKKRMRAEREGQSGGGAGPVG